MQEKATLGFHPLYIQIKELLVKRLVSGEWRPGQVLPSEIALAAEYGVSQGTLRKALIAMEHERLVFRRQGRGTFVAKHTPGRSLFQFFHLVGENGERQLPDSQVLHCRRGIANSREREALQLAARTAVTRIYRVRRLNGEPVIAEEITVTTEHFAGLHRTSRDALPNTLYELYETRYNVTVVRAIERIRAVAAAAREAELLGTEPGAPLLEIDRVALNIERKPVEWRLSRCSTQHHHYLNELD